jgi:hypothetical protein
MIYEIKPPMFDTPHTRKALNAVMKKLNITRYYVAVTTKFLTVSISEEDAIMLELVDGSNLIWQRFMDD